MVENTPSDPNKPNDQMYLHQMAQIRDRLNAVMLMAYSEQVFKGTHDYLIESMFLQVRKVLELIAFASLTANQAKYAAVYKEFERHWKAAKMLEALKKVNPNFYPQPVELRKVPAKGEAAEYALLKEGFLTQDEFVFLYDVTSTMLHTRNPFQADVPVEIKYDVSTWVERMRQLLRIHIMHFVDGRRWLVYAPEQGKHQVFTVVGREYPPPGRISGS